MRSPTTESLAPQKPKATRQPDRAGGRLFPLTLPREGSLILRFAAIVALALSTHAPTAAAADSLQGGEPRHASKRHRMVVLTDIEADPDDTQSLVRLLLYSEGIDIQGLIATTSTHMRTSVHPESIRGVIRAYAKAHQALLKHDANYSRPEALEALVKQGGIGRLSRVAVRPNKRMKLTKPTVPSDCAGFAAYPRR